MLDPKHNPFFEHAPLVRQRGGKRGARLVRVIALRRCLEAAPFDGAWRSGPGFRPSKSRCYGDASRCS
jgi:hypothetical protein